MPVSQGCGGLAFDTAGERPACASRSPAFGRQVWQRVAPACALGYLRLPLPGLQLGLLSLGPDRQPDHRVHLSIHSVNYTGQRVAARHAA